MRARPEPFLHTTSLWDFPSANYASGGGGSGRQGSPDYPGATPSHVIWNLLARYTRPKDLVVDPMCGGGTTLDVCRDLGRRAKGFDLQPQRRDVVEADARKLPLKDGEADFVFVDPPYSTHLSWSKKPECLGEANAFDTDPERGFFGGLAQVIAEIDRVLAPDRYAAVYIGDSAEPGKGFAAIGFHTFRLLQERFTPVDEIAVVRHHKGLQHGRQRTAAAEGNFILRGFHHLYVVAKGEPGDRRDPEEAARLAVDFQVQQPGRRPGGGQGGRPGRGRHHRD